MKYVKECLIIFGITLAGEVLNGILPLPVPAGVYGLFLLLFLLCRGILKLEDVEATGNFLLDIHANYVYSRLCGTDGKLCRYEGKSDSSVCNQSGIYGDRYGSDRNGGRADSVRQKTEEEKGGEKK